MGRREGSPLCAKTLKGDNRNGDQTMKECQVSLGLEYQNDELGIH